MNERASATYSLLFYCDDQFEAKIYDAQGNLTGYYMNDNHQTGYSDRPTQMSFTLLDTVDFPPRYEDMREDMRELRLAFGHYANLASLEDVKEVVRYWNATNPRLISQHERIMEEYYAGKYPDIRHKSFDEIIATLRIIHEPEYVLKLLDAALDGGIVLDENLYYVEILQSMRDAAAEDRLRPLPVREKNEAHSDFVKRYYEYVFSYDPDNASLPL